MISKIKSIGVVHVVLIIAWIAAFGAVFFVVKNPVFAQEFSVEARLAGKSTRERANIKASEIIASNPGGTYQDSAYGLTIEIQSIEKIEGGVQVFARAWKGGQQLGFGKDGSVEIERFRIFNPPMLVDDPNGSIVREWVDDTTKETHQMKFREDPSAAIRKDLAHTISVVGKNGSNIVRGKVGNTTSTFRPDAHPESTSVDGRLKCDDCDVSWDTVHDATTATDLDDDGTIFNPRTTFNNNNSKYGIYRAVTGFDTSPIGTGDTIYSAIVSLYATDKTNNDNDGDDFIVPVGSVSLASNTSLAAGDYDAIGSVNSPTEYASRVDIGDISTSAYNNFTLNSNGRGAINTSGVTNIGWREGHDVVDSPVSNAGSNTSSVTFSASDDGGAGTTQDPVLVIVHSSDAPMAVRKPSTQTVTSDASTDDDSALSIGLAENEEYVIDGVIFASSTSGVPDIKIAFTVPTGALMDIAIIPSSGEPAELLQSSGTDSDGIPLPANQVVAIHIGGTVKMSSTSGNLTLQWSQDQSSGTAVGVLRGSYLRADDI